ncbi:hypothetical protein K432DRAFT_409703 [Lepidopterella palustris CBS 459.81]|uniref:Uncharacterized protein n=1 Tax=Lepidopterella palustris CBS 459.81 TaxID=1314670 RepID=A0A8E2J9T6_9PEZI|nr:hypothetical protein K432DRAFT_409703 [Lepidopterella palustris CBS 459.81]
MSRDDAYVAVGFGTNVHLCHYKDCWQIWHSYLTVGGFANAQEVKFQVVNFSSDSQSVVVATQRYDIMRTKEDDMVYTYVWECRQTPPKPLKLPGCKMPTDARGLSSIFYNCELKQAFITGFTDAPYPLFLSATGETCTPYKINFKIRCTAEAPASSNAAVFMDSKNKVCRVDLRKQSVQYWDNISAERGRLSLKDETAAIATPDGSQVYVFWRQGTALCLLEMRDGKKGNLQNLRWLYDTAVEGN